MNMRSIEEIESNIENKNDRSILTLDETIWDKLDPNRLGYFEKSYESNNVLTEQMTNSGVIIDPETLCPAFVFKNQKGIKFTVVLDDDDKDYEGEIIQQFIENCNISLSSFSDVRVILDGNEKYSKNLNIHFSV